METSAGVSPETKPIQCYPKNCVQPERSSYGGEKGTTDFLGVEEVKRPWSYGGTTDCLLGPPVDRKTQQQLDEFEEVINRMACMTRGGPPPYPGTSNGSANFRKKSSGKQFDEQISDRSMSNQNTCQSVGKSSGVPLYTDHQQQLPPPYPTSHSMQQQVNNESIENHCGYSEIPQCPIDSAQNNSTPSFGNSCTTNQRDPVAIKQQVYPVIHPPGSEGSALRSSTIDQRGISGIHDESAEPPQHGSAPLTQVNLATSQHGSLPSHHGLPSNQHSSLSNCYAYPECQMGTFSTNQHVSAVTGRTPHNSPRPTPYPSPLTSPNTDTSTPPSSNPPSRKSSLSRLYSQVPVSPVRIHVTAPWEPRGRPLGYIPPPASVRSINTNSRTSFKQQLMRTQLQQEDAREERLKQQQQQRQQQEQQLKYQHQQQLLQQQQQQQVSQSTVARTIPGTTNAVATSVSLPPSTLQVQSRLENPTLYHVLQTRDRQERQNPSPTSDIEPGHREPKPLTHSDGANKSPGGVIATISSSNTSNNSSNAINNSVGNTTKSDVAADSTGNRQRTKEGYSVIWPQSDPGYGDLRRPNSSGVPYLPSDNQAAQPSLSMGTTRETSSVSGGVSGPSSSHNPSIELSATPKSVEMADAFPLSLQQQHEQQQMHQQQQIQQQQQGQQMQCNVQQGFDISSQKNTFGTANNHQKPMQQQIQTMDQKQQQQQQQHQEFLLQHQQQHYQQNQQQTPNLLQQQQQFNQQHVQQRRLSLSQPTEQQTLMPQNQRQQGQQQQITHNQQQQQNQRLQQQINQNQRMQQQHQQITQNQRQQQLQQKGANTGNQQQKIHNKQQQPNKPHPYPIKGSGSNTTNNSNSTSNTNTGSIGTCGSGSIPASTGGGPRSHRLSSSGFSGSASAGLMSSSVTSAVAAAAAAASVAASVASSGMSSAAASYTSDASEVDDVIEEILSLEESQHLGHHDNSSYPSTPHEAQRDALGLGPDSTSCGDLEAEIKEEPACEVEVEMIAIIKDRKKKDNHNMIERRRRFHINDRIKELATLLPTADDPHFEMVRDIRHNKGEILTATVAYIKRMKTDLDAAKEREAKRRGFEQQNRQMHLKIQELESMLRAHGIKVEGTTLSPSLIPTLINNNTSNDILNTITSHGTINNSSSNHNNTINNNNNNNSSHTVPTGPCSSSSNNSNTTNNTSNCNNNNNSSCISDNTSSNNITVDSSSSCGGGFNTTNSVGDFSTINMDAMNNLCNTGDLSFSDTNAMLGFSTSNDVDVSNIIDTTSNDSINTDSICSPHISSSNHSSSFGADFLGTATNNSGHHQFNMTEPSSIMSQGTNSCSTNISTISDGNNILNEALTNNLSSLQNSSHHHSNHSDNDVNHLFIPTSEVLTRTLTPDALTREALTRDALSSDDLTPDDLTPLLAATPDHLLDCDGRGHHHALLDCAASSRDVVVPQDSSTGSSSDGDGRRKVRDAQCLSECMVDGRSLLDELLQNLSAGMLDNLDLMDDDNVEGFVCDPMFSSPPDPSSPYDTSPSSIHEALTPDSMDIDS